MTSAKPSNSARTALKLLPQKQPLARHQNFSKMEHELSHQSDYWLGKQDGLCN